MEEALQTFIKNNKNLNVVKPEFLEDIETYVILTKLAIKSNIFKSKMNILIPFCIYLDSFIKTCEDEKIKDNVSDFFNNLESVNFQFTNTCYDNNYKKYNVELFSEIYFNNLYAVCDEATRKIMLSFSKEAKAFFLLYFDKIFVFKKDCVV